MFLIIAPGFLKLGLIMLILGGLVMGLVSKLRKLFTKNKKKFFIYTIVVLLLFALTALLANDNVLNNSPLGNFISFQILFLAFGSGHVWVLRKFFPDLNTELSDFWPEFIYTIVITLFGLVGFMCVVQAFKIEYTYIFLAAGICFMLPFLGTKLYEYALAVPVPVYKTWEYPVDAKIKDPKDEEFKNLKVISFEFNKSIDSEEISNFRLKAPEDMEFGRLFYFFINDYNERHPENIINVLDASNAAYKWSFFSKPNWMGTRKHFDFNKTVASNGIVEDDVILCQRVL
jgi:hypothetical protein